MISLNRGKYDEREELKRKTDEFLANGGEIQVLGITESKQYSGVNETVQSAALGKAREKRGPGITITPGSRNRG